MTRKRILFLKVVAYDTMNEAIKEYLEEYKNADTQIEVRSRAAGPKHLEYQYYQVRKDYKWVQEQYALSGDKSAIRREILLQRIRGSNRSPF